MTPTFRHDVAGTCATAWVEAIAALPLLELPAARRLVVVGAHPDDETLGAGGLVHVAGRAGWRTEVVTATAGEGSHPGSPTHTPARLADVRRGELDAAVAILDARATTTCLGLPDGDVAAHVDEVVARLVEVIGTDGADVLLCAPYRHDGHPDHEAVSRAAALAAARTDARLLEYPVWLWHWGTTTDLPADRASRLALDASARDAKARAIRAHASQVAPLSTQAGDEVLLDAGFLAHFERTDEVLLEPEPVDDDVLDRVHRERPDPWQVDSFYERRKRAVTLAALPREHYARALEVGCSIGALAEDLATRTDVLVAIDSSREAVDLARARVAGLPRVDVRRARVPDEWPEGRFDLVSVSEVGYFLSPQALRELVRRCVGSLNDGGHLLLCHWRHQPEGWPLAGPAVHEQFLATFHAAGAEVLVEHHETDFLLHVLGRPS